jgi:hypothetical protein
MSSHRTVTRADHITEVIPFPAGDGTPLTLVHVTTAVPPDAAAPEKGPVLLVHGAGVRAELFRPPLPRTLVDALLEDGWDVWLLNWRASIDFEPLSWTLADAAVYDHPAAVDYVLGATGAETLKAVIHCQGSVSFTMAAVAGLLPRVDTIVSNAVSLHPVIPLWSVVKITYLAGLLKPFTPYLSPAWGYKSNGYFSRMLRFMVKATHDWISGEFAEVPFTFLSEMGHSVLARRIVAAGGHPQLPRNFLAEAPQTDARFAFLAGRNNRCFLPESQERTFAFFQGHRPGRDSLHLLSGYGHLDVFFGARAWADTYPVILKELNR